MEDPAIGTILTGRMHDGRDLCATIEGAPRAGGLPSGETAQALHETLAGRARRRRAGERSQAVSAGQRECRR